MGNYFFWGQEEYNIEQEINKFKEKYLDENFSSLNLRYFYSPSYKDLSNILHTTGTMFGSIINIINCNEYIFPAKGVSILSDDDIEKIKEELKISSDNVYNLFILKIPRDLEYARLQKVPSKPLCKILIKGTQSVEFKEYRNYDKELPTWIIKKAKENDLTISTDAAYLMIEKVGVNLTLLNSQIEKLKLCIYPNTKITKEDISNCLNETEDVFKIAEYILQGRKDFAVLEFKKTCEKKHYLEVLALLQTNFSKWIDVKSGIETMTLAQVADKQKMKEYPLKLLLQKLSGRTLSELISLKKNFIRAEENIKINYSLNADLEIEKAILSDV